jgi:hypothetical protein
MGNVKFLLNKYVETKVLNSICSGMQQDNKIWVLSFPSQNKMSSPALKKNNPNPKIQTDLAN